MQKHQADILAVVLTRDILKTSSAASCLPLDNLNKYSATNIGEFIKTLSSELESLDDSISLSNVFNAHRNQPTK